MRDRKKAIEAEAAEYEKLAAELTTRIETRNAQKQKAIAEAEMPVEGMSLGGGQVLLKGLPFDQASGAQRLRTSVAVAMAGNPKLRVIRIKDGSLLDNASLQLISDMAADRDYQVWIERVDDSGKIGIVMEDGEVAADYQREN